MMARSCSASLLSPCREGRAGTDRRRTITRLSGSGVDRQAEVSPAIDGLYRDRGALNGKDLFRCRAPGHHVYRRIGGPMDKHPE